MIDDIPEIYNTVDVEYIRIDRYKELQAEVIKLRQACYTRTGMEAMMAEHWPDVALIQKTELARRESCVVSMEQDAKRYRYLRGRHGGYIEVIGPEGDEREQYLYEDALDAAVDSALCSAAPKTEKHPCDFDPGLAPLRHDFFNGFCRRCNTESPKGGDHV